jgi:glycine oxidase
MPHERTAIIGGGVIGLAIAFRLSQRGVPVTVFDAGLPGQASRAAAGMLSPLAECREPGPLADLALDGLRCFPAFLADLNETADCRVRPFGEGMLTIAITDDEAAGLVDALKWQNRSGFPVEWAEGETLRRIEPELGSIVAGGIISPSEKHIDPPELIAQLQTACERLGARLVRNTAIAGVDAHGGVVRAVRLEDRSEPCSRCIVAAGAWSARLAEWFALPAPIVPVRGQMVGLGPAAPALFRHAIFRRHGYLVPRADGRIVLGGTEEHAGYDDRATVDQVAKLLSAAVAVVPALGTVAIESVWAGLRPVSGDNLPIIGRIPNWSNAFLASGHGRKGILLSAVTARLLTGAILDDEPIPEAFSPGRFQFNS